MQATKTAAKEPVREMAHILVVDDERSICELLEITFRKEGHRVELAHDVESAKRKLQSQIFDIVISDVRMPGETGVDLLKFTKEIAPDSFFLLVTGVPTLDTAIAAINAGADRYVIKDHELVDQLRRAVRSVTESMKWKKEAGYLRRELRRLTGLDNIIGQSPKMRGYASTPGMSSGGGNSVFPEGGVDFEKEIADTERRYLLAALERQGE